MENKKTVILFVKEAEEFFLGLEDEMLINIELINAKNSDELVKYTYIYEPDFILFNISKLSEDNYISLSKLKGDAEKSKYRMLFIRTKDEAKDILETFKSGANPYFLKLFGMMEKNARVLDFIELKHARDEMSVVYNELKQANIEIKKKNKQLQQAINNIEKLSTTDFLTGAYNRRYMIERIKQEIIRYKRTRRIFSFVLCDIDDFKKINDTGGHAQGDQILVDAVRFLTESCREMDILSRWGGDEFLFVLPETDVSGALVFAERVRNLLAEKVFEYDHKEIKFFFTFGVAEYDEREGFGESIKNADYALLEGKSSGKNKVVAYDKSVMRRK